MLEMETAPSSIDDPQLTRMTEAGDQPKKIYYLNQKSWEITLTAERRRLPRGGIL